MDECGWMYLTLRFRFRLRLRRKEIRFGEGKTGGRGVRVKKDLLVS